MNQTAHFDIQENALVAQGEILSVVVYSLSGKAIYQEKNVLSSKAVLPNLPAGIYFARLMTKGGMDILKFIIL